MIQPGSTLAVPLVSISLVTWNGLRWLPGCLASVAAQDLDGGADAIELLVLDNGSTDGTADWLRDHLPRTPAAGLVCETTNLGYAAAHDRNIERAAAPFVLLLNQDVELDPGFLRAAVAALLADPIAASVQGRVRRLGDDGERLSMLDTTGLVMGRDRRVVSRAQGEPDGPAHAVAGAVWGADGPVPVYRRDALRRARLPSTEGGWEILDHAFFAYKEDVDLAWRLRRLGWTCRYEPAAIAWHARGGSASATGDLRTLRQARAAVPAAVKVRSWRNQRWMQLKNDPVRAVLRDLLPILGRELASFAFSLLYDRAVLRAIPPTIAGLPAAWRKRQALRGLIRDGSAAPPWTDPDEASEAA